MVARHHQNQRGVLLIPLCLMTVIVALTGFGIWGLLRHWRQQVELQLRLDECVGKKALELKSLLGSLTSSNTRMTWVRRSVVVSVIAPEALEVIRTELTLEMTYQESLKAKWQVEGGFALAGRGCPGFQAHALQYPFLSWERLPPDEIGPHPFEWKDPRRRYVLLYQASSLFGWGLRSGAEVQGDQSGKNNWHSRWVSSLEALRTGFH